MGEIGNMLRQKIVSDKADAARNRKEDADAKKAEEAAKKAVAAKASAPEKKAETAKASAPAKAKGKAASANRGAKKVVAAKGKAEPHTFPKVAPDVSKGGSCPDDSLVYRGPSYDKVRYYKNATIYHDVGRSVWRLKAATGSRRTIKKSFKTNPKQAWAELVDVIRKMNP